MKKLSMILLLLCFACGEQQAPSHRIEILKEEYTARMQGFWLAQCIANWTGLVTEMDKIGGEGMNGRGAGFYTRAAWGGRDEPNIWSEGPSPISDTIDFVFVAEDEIWGADDDTDIEYIYQQLMLASTDGKLTGEEIRKGWLQHIYTEENTPFDNHENYLWVSNQRAQDLMVQGKVPPETSDPELNSYYEMIDAQLTTEIFGLFAPGRPDVAVDIAYLPVRTTARGEAALAAEFYIRMHANAILNQEMTMKDRVFWMAAESRKELPENSYLASMYDYVKSSYEAGIPWEETRDGLHERYQVNQEAGYDWFTRDQVCNGCFAAGINFGASMVSLFYGEGDLKTTIKIGVLSGWDSDNPTATWGGLLGFMLGMQGVEDTFGRTFSNRFNIHRTRGGFDNDGIDTFELMALNGVAVVDKVVEHQIGGEVTAELWRIPIH